MKNILSTKANTLKALQGKLQYSKVLPQISFTFNEWQNNRQGIICEFQKKNWGGVIVRSSAIGEDSEESSKAGQYDSVSNVSGVDSLIEAVSKAFNSYTNSNPNNQVLIQPMLIDVKVCGVAFTKDPNSGSDYYVINYDESGSTSSITGGCENGDGKLFYLFKNYTGKVISPKMERLIMALGELEEFFLKDNLDVEFAFDIKDELYIFQVRPLIIKEKGRGSSEIGLYLNSISEKIIRDQKKKVFLCGDTTIYSVMTDWNPAEMIGIKPRSLAMSLYKELITDNVWAYQRDNYGYRNLRSVPLMVDFAGMPYIDVRVSFNSFIPATLSDELSEKLVNYYIDRLKNEPHKHDKAEFDIIFSCYSFDLWDRINVLKKYGFTDEEIFQIVDSLRDVTNKIINSDDGLYKKDSCKIEILKVHYEAVINSDMDPTEKIYWLMEDCKRYGTLPFAGLARGAFIAVQILKSMVNKGILSQKDYDTFMNEIQTVSKKMSRDFKFLSKKEFLKEYGHLRPGTYDINSLRYDEGYDIYFDKDKIKGLENAGNEDFKMSIQQMNQLKSEIENAGLKCDILGMMDYIRTVIEGREYGKFVFTKNVSMILNIIEELGDSYGFSRDDMSYVNIKTVMGAYSSTVDLKEVIAASIEAGKKVSFVSEKIALPPVITKPNDVYQFFYPDSEPNYITIGNISALVIKEKDIHNENIKGKIVMIKSADPGYDWIFSKGISGFISMYGGANSHMAIRAGELGIPAAIGVGEKLYNKLNEASMVQIDCVNKKIRVLRKRDYI